MITPARALRIIVALSLGAGALPAQQITRTVPVSAGSEIERYERALQLIGAVPAGEWSVRPFGRSERETISRARAHPWAGAIADSARGPASGWSVVAPSMALIFNSGFPYGFNDGAVWAGRGATASASGGIAVRGRLFSAVFAPTAFIAQNAFVSLAPSLETGAVGFADWNRTTVIDLPQRFGSKPYGRVDLGESRLSVDTRWISLGGSSEAQVWGPSVEEPLILGNNAGGFPHLFVETSRPVNVGIGRLSGRILWGRLDQSSYFGIRDSATTPAHFGSGAVVTIPLGWPAGLEVGAARFFHTSWGSGSLRSIPWFKPFGEIFKNQLPRSLLNPNGDDVANQLASAFFRWAPPAARFELYGEFGREDHSGDLRDFVGEPDHDAAYTIGFQRAWSADSGSMSVLRWEVMNSRISHLTGQSPWYIHGYIRQGHTERGQLLAAPGGYGGGGTSLAFDRYTNRGRTTIRLDRLMAAEARLESGLPVSDEADVSYALRVERMRFTRGGMWSLTGGVVRELNRHFASDAWNLNIGSSFTLPSLRAPERRKGPAE